MNTPAMSHEEARRLLQVSVDAPLAHDARARLDAHLAACPACQTYARDLRRLHESLSRSLPARWPEPVHAGRTLDQSLADIEARVNRRRFRQRFLSAAQPVVWTAGVILLIGVMAGAISAIRSNTGDEPTGSQTPDETATAQAIAELTLTPQGTTTLGVCAATVRSNVEVYASPEVSPALLGTLPAGTVAQVFAVYYAPSQEPWLQIAYGGAPGWISATQVSAEGDCGTVPQVVATGSPLPPELGTLTPIPPPPTLTPSPTPLPPPTGTATATYRACMVAPTDDPGVNLAVYDGPSTTAIVLGSVGIGEYLPATGIYYPPNYDTWVQVQFRGMVGWVQAIYWMFDGNGCWPLPQVTLSAPPPTWTANPWTPTLLPTSTLAPEVDVNHVLYVRGDVGWSNQFTGTLPTAEGGTVEFVGVRVNEIPVGEVRLLNILVQCAGANPQQLRWGYYGSPTEWECGRYIDTGVSQGGNLVMLALTVPNDGTVQVTYTITATVNAVP